MLFLCINWLPVCIQVSKDIPTTLPSSRMLLWTDTRLPLLWPCLPQQEVCRCLALRRWCSFSLSVLRWGSGISKRTDHFFTQAGWDSKHWHRVSGEKENKFNCSHSVNAAWWLPEATASASPELHEKHWTALWFAPDLSEKELFVFHFPFP